MFLEKVEQGLVRQIPDANDIVASKVHILQPIVIAIAWGRENRKKKKK